MFGWLQKKSENARVYMCVKELKWELEAASKIHRAKILAMAQLLRTTFSDFPNFEDAIENPLDYPRSQIATFYTEMESMRNSASLQMKQLSKQFESMGISLPSEMQEHVKLSNRALEVWMTLFGCGLAPDCRDDVREIWMLLSGAIDDVPNAITELRAMSSRQAKLTGEDMFSSTAPHDEDWIILCNFIPKQFTKNLF